VNQPKLLNTEAAAAILGTSTRTVKVYAATGRIQAQKIAGAWQFTEEALTRFMKGEKPNLQTAAALGALVPGLAAELDTLRAIIEKAGGPPDALHKIEDISSRFIGPMTAIVETGRAYGRQ
jgi:hypothetical protein